jgi:hypothetical protein
MKIEELRLNIDGNIKIQLSMLKEAYSLAIADKTQINKIETWAKQLTTLIKIYHECCEREIIEFEKLTDDIITDHIFAISMQKDKNINESSFENSDKDLELDSDSNDWGQFTVEPIARDDNNK